MIFYNENLVVVITVCVHLNVLTVVILNVLCYTFFLLY